MRNNGLSNFALYGDDEAPVAAVTAEIESDAERTGFPFEPSTLDPETVARRYLEQALTSSATPTFTIEENMEKGTEFRSLGTETLPLTGTRTVKFYQTYHRIPIYGSLVTVELDENNALVSMVSALGEPKDVDPSATLSPKQAEEKIRKSLGKDAPPLESPPRLYFYFDGEAERWRLVYIAKDIFKTKPRKEKKGHVAAPELADYVVDAHTGKLVAELPRSQSAGALPHEELANDELAKARRIRSLRAPDGKRQLHDPVRNVKTYDFGFRNAKLFSSLLPGDTVGNPPDPWHPAAISAHANATEVAEYLVKVLQRNGLDNKGGPFISSVNCIFLGLGQPVTKEWRNAMWIKNQMIYGQRLVEGKLRSYAIAKDIVAHEIVHGLTDNTARLEYLAMSGALNESYSDIFGILISNYSEAKIGKWNWQLGEDLDTTGVPLRDLSDPTRSKRPQPAHMDDYEVLPVNERNDWGGVHINSGIHNKAAYNLITARKASGRYVFSPVEAAALFYLALTQRLSRTSGFSDSRRAVEASARALFRKAAPAARALKLAAVSKAFDDVGIT